jgi:hypothetical protein
LYKRERESRNDHTSLSILRNNAATALEKFKYAQYQV